MDFFKKMKDNVEKEAKSLANSAKVKVNLTSSKKEQIPQKEENKNAEKQSKTEQSLVQQPAAIQKEKKEGFFDKLTKEPDGNPKKIERLYIEIRQANVEAVRTILQKSKNPVNPNLRGTADDCETLLVTAALLSIIDSYDKQKMIEIMNLLVDAGADVNQSDNNGFSPLHALASHNNIPLIQKLKSKGADMNAGCGSKEANFRNITPLHVACQQSQPSLEVVKALINCSADPNQAAIIEGAEGWTPLNVAASRNQWELVKLLVENNAKIDVGAQNADKTSSWGALHFATAANQKEIVEFLLQKGTNIDFRGKSNESPILIAARKGHFGLVDLLIDKKANLNYVLNDDKHSKCSALHYTILKGEAALVEKMIKSGADVNISGYIKGERYKQDSMTTWQFALESKNKQILKTIFDTDYKFPHPEYWVWDGSKVFRDYESEWASLESSNSGESINLQIIEVYATNILPKDSHFGKASSDPYFKILTLQPNGKIGEKLYQSKVIEKQLNPLWLQKSDPPINLNIKGSSILIFTIFDKDRITKDDFEGCCRIHLAPLTYFKVQNFSTTLPLHDVDPETGKKEEATGTLSVTLKINYK